MPSSRPVEQVFVDPLEARIRAFPAIRLKVLACTETQIQLPEFKGSTLRGGLGVCLKRLVCVRKPPECDACDLSYTCVYSRVFETPPPPDSLVLRKYPRAPHPFVIEPPDSKKRFYEKGETFSFSLVLLGRAIDLLPYIACALDELGRVGIGRGRGKFRVQEVSQRIFENQNRILFNKQEPRFVPPVAEAPASRINGTASCERIGLRFLTPSRIVHGERYARKLDFHVIFRTLLRRFTLISHFHWNPPPEDFDFADLVRRSEEEVITEQTNLQWFDWERYSSRQDRKIPMGGLIGFVSFRGNIDPFFPLLHLGQWLHVGKGTVMGMGRYELELNPPSEGEGGEYG